jgi:hypothetical protein
VATPTVPPLHPLLAARVSPSRFDARRAGSQELMRSLLEAARWAPSAGNSQPWAFIPALRGEPTHRRLTAHLARSSRAWAGDAALLVANLCHVRVEDTEWEYSDFAMYDLGQAVSHMVVQAQALGWSARQFRAFDREGVEAEFDVPPHWAVVSMTAFGAGEGAAGATRERRSIDDLVWPAGAFAPCPTTAGRPGHHLHASA